MILPVQTTFRNTRHSDAVEARIQEEADKLNKYFDRITSCRVMVEAAHRHHKRGDPFHIRIELGVPGKELVVAHEPTLRKALMHDDEGHLSKSQELEAPHKDVYVAIRDAFKAMRRQLQDYVHCLRQEVKAHVPAPHARVVSLFPEKDHGFIETSDGREIYFHRNSLLNSTFENLEIGTEVLFNEEAGDNGPRATSVRLAGKHHPAGMPEE
jgi:cold shock CspA family protein/ribosome-associated translation inhibitor RaiA